MNEEEKKAIETLKSWKDYNIRNKNKLLRADEIIKIQETILNLIEKLQKEKEKLEEINNELEAEKNEAIRRYNFEAIPIKKVKDKIKKLSEIKGNFATHIATSERIKVLSELLESEE